MKKNKGTKISNIVLAGIIVGVILGLGSYIYSYIKIGPSTSKAGAEGAGGAQIKNK